MRKWSWVEWYSALLMLVAAGAVALAMSGCNPIDDAVNDCRTAVDEAIVQVEQACEERAAEATQQCLGAAHRAEWACRDAITKAWDHAFAALQAWLDAEIKSRFEAAGCVPAGADGSSWDCSGSPICGAPAP